LTRSCQSGGKKLSGVDAQRWPADSTAVVPRTTACELQQRARSAGQAPHQASGAFRRQWIVAMQDQPAETPVSGASSRSPATSHSRIAQQSHGVRVSRGPRFVRFAAALEADPPSQDQLLDGLGRRRGHATAASSIRPLGRVRIPTANPVKSLVAIQWLGVGGWALSCAVLFASLLLRPDAVSLPLDQIHPRALASDVRPLVDSMPTTRLRPAHGQEVPDLDARPADQGTRAGFEGQEIVGHVSLGPEPEVRSGPEPPPVAEK